MSTLRVLSHYSLFTNNNKKQSPPPPKLPRLQVEKEGKWREVESSPAVQNCQRQIRVRFYIPQILVINAFSVKKWRSMWNSIAIKPLKPSLSFRFNLGHHFIQLAGIWNGLLIKYSCGKSVNISCRATSPFSVQSEFCAGLTFDRGVSYVRPGEGYLWENHTGLYHVSCTINELIVIASSCTLPLPLLLLILQFYKFKVYKNTDCKHQQGCNVSQDPLQLWLFHLHKLQLACVACQCWQKWWCEWPEKYSP